jgi:hypothetical protein
MTMRREALVFALVYTALSLATEMILVRFVGLKMHKDDALIWLIILTIPPVLAAWTCGYRRPKGFVLLVVLTAVLTFIITQIVVYCTLFHTGLVEPIIDRSIAGFLAGEITKQVAAKTREAG